MRRIGSKGALAWCVLAVAGCSHPRGHLRDGVTSVTVGLSTIPLADDGSLSCASLFEINVSTDNPAVALGRGEDGSILAMGIVPASDGSCSVDLESTARALPMIAGGGVLVEKRSAVALAAAFSEDAIAPLVRGLSASPDLDHALADPLVDAQIRELLVQLPDVEYERPNRSRCEIIGSGIDVAFAPILPGSDALHGTFDGPDQAEYAAVLINDSQRGWLRNDLVPPPSGLWGAIWSAPGLSASYHPEATSHLDVDVPLAELRSVDPKGLRLAIQRPSIWADVSTHDSTMQDLLAGLEVDQATFRGAFQAAVELFLNVDGLESRIDTSDGQCVAKIAQAFDAATESFISDSLSDSSRLSLMVHLVNAFKEFVTYEPDDGSPDWVTTCAGTDAADAVHTQFADLIDELQTLSDVGTDLWVSEGIAWAEIEPPGLQVCYIDMCALAGCEDAGCTWGTENDIVCNTADTDSGDTQVDTADTADTGLSVDTASSLDTGLGHDTAGGPDTSLLDTSRTDSGVTPDTGSAGSEDTSLDTAGGGGLDREFCVVEAGADFDLGYLLSGADGSYSDTTYWVSGGSSATVALPFITGAAGAATECADVTLDLPGETVKINGADSDFATSGLWGNYVVGLCNGSSHVVLTASDGLHCSVVEVWVDDVIDGSVSADAVQVTDACVDSDDLCFVDPY